MWEQIRSNRIRSAVLVAGMALILLFLGFFIGLAIGSWVVGLVIALLVWGIMTLIAFFQGDSIILSMAHAKKITPADNQRLFDVVEEMKIASALEKMPDVYIIDDSALNAFATGRDPNHSAIAITSGLLEILNRDELQGVIGHEISHIKNRDVRLMSLLTVLLGTIVILAWYAWMFAFLGAANAGAGNTGRGRSSSGNRRGNGGGGIQIFVAIFAILLAILAPIFAQLIYFAVSRKREYLADASSALYTRYPEGLASALEKLSRSEMPLKSANKATAPMYIINPFKKKGMSLSDLTSTHPPTAERIRILRSMAGGSYADYEKAYEQSKGKGGLIPPSALTGAGDDVPLRKASS
jgi:heat shock protein HtpX